MSLVPGVRVPEMFAANRHESHDARTNSIYILYSYSHEYIAESYETARSHVRPRE